MKAAAIKNGLNWVENRAESLQPRIKSAQKSARNTLETLKVMQNSWLDSSDPEMVSYYREHYDEHFRDVASTKPGKRKGLFKMPVAVGGLIGVLVAVACGTVSGTAQPTPNQPNNVREIEAPTKPYATLVVQEKTQAAPTEQPFPTATPYPDARVRIIGFNDDNQMTLAISNDGLAPLHIDDTYIELTIGDVPALKDNIPENIPPDGQWYELNTRPVDPNLYAGRIDPDGNINVRADIISPYDLNPDNNFDIQTLPTPGVPPTMPPNTPTLPPNTPTLPPNTPTLPPNTPTLPPNTPTLPPNTPTLPPNTPTPEPLKIVGPDVFIKGDIRVEDLIDGGNFIGYELRILVSARYATLTQFSVNFPGLEGIANYRGKDATNGITIDTDIPPGRARYFTFQVLADLKPGEHSGSLQVTTPNESEEQKSDNTKNYAFTRHEPIEATQETLDYVISLATKGYDNQDIADSRVIQFEQKPDEEKKVVRLYIATPNAAQKYKNQAALAIKYLDDNGWDAKIVDRREDANGEFHLDVDAKEFETIFPKMKKEFRESNNALATYTKISGNKIEYVTMAVAKNDLDGVATTEEFKMHAILEEPLNIYTGLKKDTSQYPGSIFYADANDTPQVIQERDALAIQYMSNRVVRPGMSEEDLRAVTKIVNELKN